MSEPTMSLRKEYGKALADLGEKDKEIVVLDADLSCSTKTSIFGQKFPERFFNMGIAEQSMAGTAAGLAASGKIPFMSSFAIFATERCFEVIRNSIAYPRFNVKIVATHTGLTVGPDGASHQAIEDISLMRSIPNMKVIVPADGIEAREVIKYVAKDQGPTYVRLSRMDWPVVHEDSFKFSEKAEVLRDGKDISIIACGLMVKPALEAAKLLDKDGISAEVVNMHVIKPIDKGQIIKSAGTGAILTVEEHSIIGGLGSAVAEVLAENKPTRMQRMGVMDVFGESGSPNALLEKYGLTANDIYKTAKKLIEAK